ncbi:RnfH family protein [Tahibacter amnicola]|uniref:UPF0125 protein N4264_16930 n=1 Tax=Tahibacter amnicola TaxID=2976241 RepID=A0ABY6BBA7_9GAMM|nr:RnfH family protein [Tahibacter amnicola]UXI66425.1 RnfH family protein [Tahibacter amnicola]
MAEQIEVEVVYATPDQLFRRTVSLAEPATVAQAIAESAVTALVPALDLAASRLGVFNRPATLETVLRNGDRVEIYRPLIANPKEVRRQRARK